MFFSIKTIGLQENLLKHLVYHIALGLYSGILLDVLEEMYHQTPTHEYKTPGRIFKNNGYE